MQTSFCNFLTKFNLKVIFPKDLQSLIFNKFNTAQCKYQFETNFQNYLIQTLQINQEFNFKVDYINVSNDLFVKSVKLTRKSVFYLMLLMFLEIIEKPKQDFKYVNFQEFNIKQENELAQQKQLCIFSYFYQYYLLKESIQDEIIQFNTISLKGSIPTFGLQNCKCQECKFTQGSIEDQNNAIIVDFADQYITGATLDAIHCAQEEIEILIHPEAIVSVLFMEVMKDTDAILFQNLIRFNDYIGYQQQFKWIQRKQLDILRINMLALDAKNYEEKDNQFDNNEIQRELLKCYIGYKYALLTHPNFNLSSGKWGCGVFKGNLTLKYLIQLISFSEVTFQLNNQSSNFIFCYLTNNEEMINLIQLQAQIQQYQITTKELYSLLMVSQSQAQLLDNFTKFNNQYTQNIQN